MMKEGQTELCGDIATPMGCKGHVANDTRYGCIVRASDPAVLRASVNIVAYYYYFLKFYSGG